MQKFNPSDPYGGFNPPFPKPPTPGKNSKIGTNPGLITSTGGLAATSGLLLTPALSALTSNSFIIIHDPNNFDTEEDAEYDFRQEANYGEIPGEGKNCTIHQIILKYRELGIAKFSINITVFNRTTDSFVTKQIPVSVPIVPISKMTKDRKKAFPDKRIHTVKLFPPVGGVIQGERPQASITRLANSGPCCITKLILCGNMDESSAQ